MWKWLWACALVLLFMPACQALEPQEARHLLARTGFGGPSQRATRQLRQPSNGSKQAKACHRQPAKPSKSNAENRGWL